MPPSQHLFLEVPHSAVQVFVVSSLFSLLVYGHLQGMCLRPSPYSSEE
jgi:hypothetical protein